MMLLTLPLVGCGCKNKGTGQTTGGGNGPSGPERAACDEHRPRVEALYRAATEVRQEDVADNTDMILGDCYRDPGRFAPCIANAESVAQLEADCVIPLDDRGTVEGDYFENRAQ